MIVSREVTHLYADDKEAPMSFKVHLSKPRLREDVGAHELEVKLEILGRVPRVGTVLMKPDPVKQWVRFDSQHAGWIFGPLLAEIIDGPIPAPPIVMTIERDARQLLIGT